MCGGMGPEHEMVINIVAVRDGTSGVISWERELVKVLIRGDERGERIEVGVVWEMGLYECAEGAQWVKGFCM